MTQNLYDTICSIVRSEMARLHQAELAIVQEQHPHSGESDMDNYACTVQLRNSGLILKQVPMATQSMGHALIPPVGSMVMVQFLNGDLNAPIITGCLYNDEDRPPLNEDSKAVWHYPLGAKDDEAVHGELLSGETRALKLKLGKTLSLDLVDDDPVIAIDVAQGKAKLTIAKDGAITIETAGDLNIKGNAISIKGSSVEITADGTMDLKGSVINLN